MPNSITRRLAALAFYGERAPNGKLQRQRKTRGRQKVITSDVSTRNECTTKCNYLLAIINL